jgi:8-oxo-dGTP diphosphatase
MSSIPVEVVALALQRKSDLRFLIARRGPGETGEGHWEFPGGKVEKNETQIEALTREISEELNYTLNPEELIFVIDHVYQYPQKTIHLSLWKQVILAEPVLKLTEHDQVAWCLPSEMQNYDISPGDLFFIDKLL